MTWYQLNYAHIRYSQPGFFPRLVLFPSSVILSSPLFFFWENLYSPRWPQTSYVVKDTFEFLSLFVLTSKILKTKRSALKRHTYRSTLYGLSRLYYLFRNTYITIKEKEDINLKESKGRDHGRAWREEVEEGNGVIIISKKIRSVHLNLVLRWQRQLLFLQRKMETKGTRVEKWYIKSLCSLLL